MKICMITNGYPCERHKTRFVFAQNFVWTARDFGHEVVVICPQNTAQKGNKSIPYHVSEKTLAGNTVEVYFPKLFSPWIGCKFPFDPIAAHYEKAFLRCVDKVLEEIKFEPDLLYAQFLNPAGIAACDLKKKYNAKAIASFGESSFWTVPKYNRKTFIKKLNSLDGIESVSSYNKKRLLEAGIKDDKTIGVFPNGIDEKRYYRMDKAKAREEFGFDKDAFIAAFLGSYIERKGPLRVDGAIGSEPGISVAYAGKGEQVPQGKNTIFASSVVPEKVATFLSAADVFVLPTLNEGCCNAIIEAMACGLPVVSSDMPFNDDILNDENSIRVNPHSESEIREAVLKIKNDPQKRESMGNAAIETAKGLSIANRVEAIIEFAQSL